MTLQILMQQAAAAVDAGDLARAEPLLLQVVGINPRDADAWHMLAVIAVRGGRAEEAVEKAKRAHELDRRNYLYLNTLGVAYGEAQQFEQAISCFKRSIKERPANAESHYNLGKAYRKKGELRDAERSYLRARQLDPQRPDVANNLAALYSSQGRLAEAMPLYAEARSKMPDDIPVAVNSALAALGAKGADAAIAELREFISRQPTATMAHTVLARYLLAEGRFAEGWDEYVWRRGKAGDPLPADLSKLRVLLVPDQGLGDHLFFLRFAPELRKRAAHVAFDCPAKLLPLLEGNDAAGELQPRGDFDLRWGISDLPRLLRATDTPPPLRITPKRVDQWRARLAAVGPGPYLGVTWRGGTKVEDVEFVDRGEVPLYKEIALDAFGRVVRGWRGTVLVLQRHPADGELAAFRGACGRDAHDFSALNEDLVDIAAVLSLIDEYVGVSNTNMHIRASLNKTARVLVPFPPEFRWMHAGDASPWFPGFTLYRQAASRDWNDALQRLAADLSR
jgi:Flp pilus assembly protein TadD